MRDETFVSVDVETSGSYPGGYSMLKIGACLARDPGNGFECTLKPVNGNFEPGAMEATGLSMEECERDGLAPAEAMAAFRDWLSGAVGKGAKPVFAGLNAPFDWSFVNHYFLAFLGENPFGHSALDVKALYMGRTGCAWGDTRSSRMDAALSPSQRGNHDALQDARYQAELLRLVLALPTHECARPGGPGTREDSK